MIPFASWTPDMPPYMSEGATVAFNVLPRPGGYEPVRGLSRLTESAAIDAPSRGAGSFYSQVPSVGGALSLVGTASKLFRVTTSGGTAIVTGLTVTDGYSWSFAGFAASVYAAAFGTGLYEVPLATGSAALVSGAPTGITVVGSVKDFLMVAESGSGEEQLHWCAQGDPSSWPTPATDAATAAQSGTQILYNGFGRIHAIVGSLRAADGIVIQERGVTRVTYVGPPTVFQFEAYEGSSGTESPRSVIVQGGVCYFMAEDGFYATDGSATRPIGEGRVNRFFKATISQSRTNEVVGLSDPHRKLVGWCYPSQSAPSGVLDRALIYHWGEDRWSLITGWQVADVFLLAPQNLTVDSPGIYTGPLDGYDLPVDTIFGARSLTFAGLDVGNYLVTPVASNLPATLETAEIAPGGESAGAFTSSVRPFVDAPAEAITGAIRWRDRVQSPLIDTALGAMTPYGIMPARTRARLQRCRLAVAAGAVWTYAQGVEVQATPTGWRA